MQHWVNAIGSTQWVNVQCQFPMSPGSGSFYSWRTMFRLYSNKVGFLLEEEFIVNTIIVEILVTHTAGKQIVINFLCDFYISQKAKPAANTELFLS